MAALAALAELSLVKHDPFEDGAPAVTVHRLVQAVARARSQAKGTAQSAVDAPDRTACGGLSGRRLQQSRLMAALARRSRRISLQAAKRTWLTPPRTRNRAELLERGRAAIFMAAASIRRRGRSYERALTIHEKALGPEHPIRRRASTTSPSCFRPRATLRGRGRSASARWRSPKRRSAPSILDTATMPRQPRRRASGPGRPCRGAAALRARAGDHREGARPRASLYGDEPQQPRPPASGPGRPRGGAAALRACAGDHREGARPRASQYGDEASATSLSCSRPRATCAGARPLCERALAITEKALGPEHRDTAVSLNNLALLLQTQGDLAGAQPLYERALAIYEKALGPDHPDIGDKPRKPRLRASEPRATSRGRGRCSSARWRSARRRSAASIPIQHWSGTILLTCFRPRATLQQRDRSWSARWRSPKKRSAPSIPIRRPCETILRTQFRGLDDEYGYYSGIPRPSENRLTESAGSIPVAW